MCVYAAIVIKYRHIKIILEFLVEIMHYIQTTEKWYCLKIVSPSESPSCEIPLFSGPRSCNGVLLFTSRSSYKLFPQPKTLSPHSSQRLSPKIPHPSA